MSAIRASFICFVLLGVFLAFLFLTILFPQQQHAATSASIYPANIEYDGDSAYGSFMQSNLTNPNIGAVDINMNWINGEPQQGTFNWGPADAEMSAWVSHGKKFTLVIRYIYELAQSCTGGKQAMPAWEIARIPNFCSAKGDVIPNFFDATFKSDLSAYVAAVANHIAASPYKSSLQYVRIGLGAAGEPYPCLGCSAADMQKLTTWGYTITSWAAWQKEMLTAFKNAFSYTNIIYPMGDNDVDPATGQPVSVEVGYWAAANGMGVGQQGLANSTGYANGQAVQIAKYVRSHYPNAYVQFQTNTTESSAANIQGDADIANSAGAFSVEWYANNSIDPAYQSIFASFQKNVDSRTCPSGCITSPTQPVTSSPTPSISQGPTPTGQAGGTSLSLTLCPHGIGKCGDNANPNGGGNASPKHTTRTVTVTLSDLQNNQVGQPQGQVTFDSTSGTYTGTVSLGALPTGDYQVVLKTQGFLTKRLPQILHITAGQPTTVPQVSLVTGDIDNNNQLDILDYNQLVNCFGSKQTTASCTTAPTAQTSGSDIDDDAFVGGTDYNLFLREISVQAGG